LRGGWGGLTFPKLLELIELLEDAEIDALRMLGQHRAPPIGDPVMSAARTFEQAGAKEISGGPPHPVLEGGDATAGNTLGTVLGR
jgi:hypothetical protein